MSQAIAIPGQRISIIISVNPQGTANYAEKLEINYPAELLESASFTFGSNWMALTQAGYDSVDNTNGVLVKTAGYPAGITASAVFGTVSFTAKKAGNGTIKIGNTSLAFEAGSQTPITGSGASFSIAAPVIAPAVTPSATPKKVTPTPAQTEKKAVVAPTETAVPRDATSQVAAVSETLPTTDAGNSRVFMLLAVIVVLALVGYGVYSLRKKQGRS